MVVSHESSVLIVGAGPVGLASALMLARAGVPCVVFEKHAGISTHPKAMGITRRTAEIFRELGIGDQMREADFSTSDTQLMIWAKSLVGEEFGRAPLPPRESPLSPCSSFHSPQPHTEAVLLAALEAEPLATVAFEHRVGEIRQHAHCVELDVMAPEGPAQWRAEWVIAADGAGSPLRRMLAVPAEGPGDLGHFHNVYFHADPGPLPAGRSSLLYNILREDLVEFLVSVNGRDLWLMHHFLQPGDEGREPVPDDFIVAIRSAMGLPDLRVNVLGVANWVMSPKVASAFRHGRVFFAGDAAARLSPAGGLGLNTGIQSVHNLAWKLAAVVHGEARESLLDSYGRERREVSLAAMHHANDNSGEVFKQVEAALRGDFEAIRASVRNSSRQAEPNSFDVCVRYGESERIPHAWLRENGRRVSTLDLVGQRFVVLAGEQASLSGKVCRPTDFEDADYPARAGFGTTGAILVRPDGFVAWKCPENATDEGVQNALRASLW